MDANLVDIDTASKNDSASEEFYLAQQTRSKMAYEAYQPQQNLRRLTLLYNTLDSYAIQLRITHLLAKTEELTSRVICSEVDEVPLEPAPQIEFGGLTVRVSECTGESGSESESEEDDDAGESDDWSSDDSWEEDGSPLSNVNEKLEKIVCAKGTLWDVASDDTGVDSQLGIVVILDD